MTPNVDTVFDAALALPVEHRAELVERLIDSLGHGTQAEIEAAWVEEVERRLKAFDEGTMKAVPANEVFAAVTAL